MVPTSWLRTFIVVGCAFLAAILFAGSLTTASAAATETGRPLFPYAMFATSNTCGAIAFTGRTDSFDSGLGTYAATKQDSVGNIGTNGNTNLSGGAIVNGTASSPHAGSGVCSNQSFTGLTTSGGASVTGGLVVLTAPITYANPPAPNPLPPTTSQAISGACGSIAGCTALSGSKNLALSPGAYGNLDISGGTTIHLRTGTYNINRLVLSGQSKLVIDSTPVLLNIAGQRLGNKDAAVNWSGGGVVNTVGLPGGFQIVYAGGSAIQLSGGTGNYGVVYAPNSAITLSGGSEWFGALVGSTISGNVIVHYDRALGKSPLAITATPDRAPNSAGWNNTNVTVGFTCSGILVTSCSSPASVTAEGANQQVSGIARDISGNTVTVTVTIKLDKTPPSLTFGSASPAPNSAGWNRTNVTFSFTATDSLSGVASTSVPSPLSVTAEGASVSGSVTVTDVAGNTAIFASPAVKIDKTSPVITLTSPANGATVQASPVTVSGTVSDSLSGVTAVTCNGIGATLAAGSLSCSVPLVNGPNSINAVATDAAGNTAAAQLTVNLGGGGGGSGLPPDPSTVAPPLTLTSTTTFGKATEFLYQGGNPIQTGVAAGTIDIKRAAVVRGKVLNRAGAPLTGGSVSILNHPEFGQTLTRADGMFDLAVNGGGPLTINYSAAGFLPAQRQIQVPWQDYVLAPDVVLIPLDAPVTTITAGAGTMQMHRGSLSTDTEGSRRATILFPGGTTAQMVLPGGGVQPLTTLNVRATEYTIGAAGPQAMPAELPPNSGYTYAVELSVDQAIAAGAIGVTFSQSLPMYVENFLNFPVGENVPLGSYDPQTGVWKGEADGRVVKIIGVTSGAADLDTDGNTSVDNGVGTGFGGADMGITLAERQTLATLYSVGQSVWRARTTHFTAIDWNWPKGPGGEPPNAPGPVNDPNKQCPCGCPPCTGKGSVLEIGNQTLGEDIPVVGTEFALHYRSDRASGRRSAYKIDIPITGPAVPAGLKAVVLGVTVAGQQFNRIFSGAPNQATSFEWDGKDAYGRTVQGVQNARVRIGFAYPGPYQRSVSTFPVSWNTASGIAYAAGVVPRSDILLFRDYYVAVGAWDARGQGIGGWTLSSHHAYDPVGRVLYLGTGERRRDIDALGPVVSTTAGNGTPGIPAEGGLAKNQPLRPLQSIPVIGAPDGSVYFINGTPTVNTRQIWRLLPNGTLQRVAGVIDSSAPRAGVPALNAFLGFEVEGLALGPDGSIYYSSRDNHTVLRIRPNDQVVELVAGKFGISGFTGDGGSALNATLSFPRDVAAGPDGSVYIFDANNHRIRRVGTDKTIVTIAGNGDANCSNVLPDPICASGAPAVSQVVGRQGVRNHLTVGPDGSLYGVRAAGFGRIELYQIGSDGILRVIAGRRDMPGGGSPQTLADNVDALSANLALIGGLAVHRDGTVWYTDQTGSAAETRVRQIGNDGIVRTIAGSNSGFGGDGGPARKANLSGPSGLGFLPNGELIVSDFTNNRLRRVGFLFPGPRKRAIFSLRLKTAVRSIASTPAGNTLVPSTR